MAANQRLLHLREQYQKNKAGNQTEHVNAPVDDHPPWKESVPSEKTGNVVSLVTRLPSHLGWESEPASQVIRAALGQNKSEPDPVADEQLRADHPSFRSMADGSYPGGQPLGVSEKTQTGSQLWPPLDGDTIKHYPSIGIAALKAEQAAIYRVWLMCRYLDVAGRGWLPVQDVRVQLSGKESKLRLFCWRRLRQILGQGHEQFWTWDKIQGRIWLFGAARVAAHLDVERLSGKPVALPVKTITAGIGDFKAHLYGAWHSGRKTNNPISRNAQETITGIPERTQRHYCKIAKVERKSNIAIGKKHTPQNVEETAWQHSRAVFDFVDSQGKQGRKGGHYLAWHLPNSYSGPHQQAPKGRMRKINRKLAGLVTKGAQGNDGEKVEKLYFANGKEAVQAVKRNTGKDKYWPIFAAKSKHHIWSYFFAA
jgi:hypothetical protein